ncbi:cupin domain-containing protein [Maricaulis maris]|uniref:Putative cupin superfamily protein n=1 Tax=Maricaulis maris TaxID=74318 RepID=A0A495DLM1_9PROT|nr:cupin domain-containing protein [Maricaulis maris]RKR03815.1 putative cupin superfamily protein [Maricaulis maris]
MPKFAVSDIQESSGTGYPPEFAGVVDGRLVRRLTGPAGLSQFGVNLVRLKPGAWSAQRHWHTHEDEFVWLVEGEAVLVTGVGETPIRAGECAGFPGGVADGHCLINKSEADCVFLVVGSRLDEDGAHYPDIDLEAKPGRYSGPGLFTRKDGSPVG